MEKVRDKTVGIDSSIIPTLTVEAGKTVGSYLLPARGQQRVTRATLHATETQKKNKREVTTAMRWKSSSTKRKYNDARLTTVAVIATEKGTNTIVIVNKTTLWATNRMVVVRNA